jgi:phosphate butyryltransferase
MRIQTAQDIMKLARGGAPKRIAVAAAEDKDVLLAVKAAVEKKIAQPVLTGSQSRIENIAKEIGLDLKKTEILPAASPEEAVEKSLAEVAAGRAQVLMKGQVNTAVFLKAVLDKKYGLRKNHLLSQVAIFFPKTYHKPVMVTDAALNIAPTLQDKIAIIGNAVEVMHKLGLETPKVALIAHNEVPTDKVLSSLDAVKLKAMNANGEIQGCIIDGPMALDVAISEEACRHKNVNSPVGGDADILVCPEIVSANVLYKSIVFLAQAHGAAIITGATVPIVLTSRSEDAETKLLSITLAVNVR